MSTLPAATVAPDLVAIRLAMLVPPDSKVVFEVCRPSASVASLARLRNPAIRFAILPLSDERGPDDVPALLGPARPQFDSVLFHEAVLALPSPFAMVGMLLPYLHPGAPVLFALPRVALERLQAGGPSASPRAAIHAALAEIGLVAVQVFTVCPDGAKDTGDFSHVIVQAVRQGELRRLLISANTLRPSGGCNDTRIDLPHAFLSTVPGVRIQSGVNHIYKTDRLPGEGRVNILQRRICSPNDLTNLKMVMQQGYLLVAEFDDHPNHWPAMTEFRHLTFRAVHAVQTSTEDLAEELRQYNPEIAIFPNQIAALPPPRAVRADGRVTLFFGAFNRGGDWHPMMEPLNQLLATHRGRIDVQVVHDRAFFDALATGDKSFTPTCSYEDYIRILQRCDIALLPLNDTLFNRCKSDLKFIECAAHSVVVLASPIVYGESVKDSVTGVLFRTPEEFRLRLEGLITNSWTRAGIAERAYRYVRDHRLLAQHFRKRLSWYSSLLERKEELDARLFERVPELRP